MIHFKLIIIIFITSGCTDAGLFVLNTLSRFGNYTSYVDIAYGEQTNQKLDIYT